MTVCVGYNTANDDYVVYLSDSWESEYIGRTLSLSTYNDFFAIVLLVQE